MQANQAWIDQFRRIPSDLHDSLALGMTTGAEIVVQKIVRLDPDFMIIRGRLAGTQDTGRVVMIPYPQLTFVAIQRDLKDADVETLFGKSDPAALASVPATPETTNPQPAPVVEAAKASEPGSVSPVKKPEAATKAALLAKLRDRLKDAGK
jgi:hypothetical protein